MANYTLRIGPVPPTTHSLTASGGSYAAMGQSTALLLTTPLDLTITRLDGGSGSVLVSNGIPLVAGQLTGAVTNVSVWVEGTEVQAYVEALKGTHPDGSVRFLFVQFNANTDTDTNAQIQFDATPGESRLSKTDVDFRTGVGTTEYDVCEQVGFPDAVALPDVDHVLSCNIMGEAWLDMISVTDATALGAPYSTYETDFVNWAEEQDIVIDVTVDGHWGLFSAITQTRIDTGKTSYPQTYNYYDRAHHHFAWWARSGDTKWFLRACAYAFSNRYFGYEQITDPYYGDVPYRASARDSLPEGLALHYWLTGDEESREGVRLLARYKYDLAGGAAWYNGISDHTAYAGEIRPIGRLLLCYAYAHTLEHTDQAWDTLCGNVVTKILAHTGYITDDQDERYGAWTYDHPQAAETDPAYVSNFMQAVLADALIYCYENVSAIGTIPGAIGKLLDYLWTYQWVDDHPTRAPSFQYYNVTSYGGSPIPSPDVLGFFPHLFAWYGKHTGTQSYINAAATQMATLVATPKDGSSGPYVYSYKQFNECYTKAWAVAGYI